MNLRYPIDKAVKTAIPKTATTSAIDYDVSNF